MSEKTIGEKLVESRILRLFEGVDDESVDRLVTSMLYLDSLNDKDITLYLNSGGGSIYSLLGLIDVMNEIKSPVTTIVTGLAASAASVILCCGDKRIATKNSTILVHQARQSGHSGTTTNSDMKIESKEMDRLNNLLASIYVERTGLPLEQIESLLDRDTYLTPERALKLNLIDEIL